MKPDRRTLLVGAAAFMGGAASACSAAQEQHAPASPAPASASPPDDTGRAIPAPSAAAYPYSGVSGPGRPTTPESARGGWRSGTPGVAYLGPHPPSFPTIPWLDYAKGTAVERGLLPPIRPLFDAHVRDTVVCLGGDGAYYLTGSTGDNIWAFNDGVELWRSTDLTRWDYLGLVWRIETDGAWERQWRTLHGLPSRAIWAPEIHFLRGNYYLCLSMAPHGISILRSTSGRAEGPYVHAFSPDQPIARGIDPTLFEDDDGKIYFTYGGARRIVEMKDDLSGFAEEWREIVLLDPDHDPETHAPKCVPRGMNDLGHEGAVLFKADGRYYLGAADNPQGRYSTMLAMSETIYGPYRGRHESVPCGGGTNFFRDKTGGLWCAYFGNDDQSPFIEKPAIVKAMIASDGRVGVDFDHYAAPARAR